MSALTIARAQLNDTAAVLQLLNGAAAWMSENGIRQWQHEFGPEHVASEISLAEMWLVRDGEQA